MTASSTTSAPTSTPPSVTAGSGWWRSSSPRSSSGCSTPPSAPAPAVGSGSSSPRPNGASGSTTSTCSTPSSGPGSSRSAPTSRIRPRCGSTVTSGPNAKPTAPGSATRRWPTGSPPATDPDALQAICDRFGPADVQAFFDRWIDVIPTPFTADRSCRRLLVGAVDAPGRGVPHPRVRRPPPGPRVLRSARHRQHRHRPPRSRSPSCSPARSAAPPRSRSRTRVFTPGTDVHIDFRYKHSRVKQYLKEGRALRIETVINKPSDIGVLARLEHLPELVAKARARQRSSAYHGTCRSGLCHRLCALRAHPPALQPRGPTNRSPALRGPTRHGPDRRPVLLSSTPSPASPTRAFAGSSPDCSTTTTPPTR